jgi:hypothetical protein
MGCGCKGNSNQTQTTQQTSESQPKAPEPKTQPIQESIRKVVEKYYNKK